MDNRKLDVDICATLLTKEPPRLPLREELPSLGFEVIYNASGVGEQASREEAKRKAQIFRHNEQIQDLKKRRFFPKTTKQIKSKLAERERIELELKQSLSAVSYKSYEQELRPRSTGSWTSSSGSQSPDGSSAMNRNNANTEKKRATSRWGVLRGRLKKKGLKVKGMIMKRRGPPKTVEFPKLSLHDIAYPDYLGPTETEESPYKSSRASRDPSSLTTPQGGLQQHKSIKIIGSPSSQRMPSRTYYDSEEGSISNESAKQAKKVDGEASGEDMFSRSIQAAMLVFDKSVGVGADFPDLLSVFGSKSWNGRNHTNTSASSDMGDMADNESGLIDINNADNTRDDNVCLKSAISNIEEALSGEMASSLTRKSHSHLATGTREDVHPFIKEDSNLGHNKDPWFSSARKVFENMATDFFKNSESNLASNDTELSMIATGNNTIEGFFFVLERGHLNMLSIRPILEEFPEFVHVRRLDDGRLPLHTVCARGLRDRSTKITDESTVLLLSDIIEFKEILSLIHGLYPNASLEQDVKGDLPVHLLARSFMNWEAQWYEAVYQEAAKEQESSGQTSTLITRLYHNMSQCIELLLKDLAKSVFHCHLPGSIGNILPLHIAAIFTSTVSTLRQMLEAYPGAGSIACDLQNLKTFVPNNSCALELHDLLSTDFPKWEVEAKQDNNPTLKWSQASDVEQRYDDCIRRSDLLFAYNPISPYRFEKSRIRRLESRLQFEAKKAIEDSKLITQASKHIWIWFCTFRETKTGAPTYLNSVKRIVSGLTLSAVRYLASLETLKGKQIIDEAIPECSRAIKKRLQELSETIIPIPNSESHLSNGVSSQSSPILKAIDGIDSARLAQSERGLVSNICRLVFNVTDFSYPTSFVILPYELTLNEDSSLGIKNPDLAPSAVRFADHLLQLTDPRSILYYLDQKSIKYYDFSLYGDDRNPNRLAAYEIIRKHEEALLELYAPGAAYLYLIDEISGMPVVPCGEHVYPIVLNDSKSLVKKLLPLMLVGMLQMRGERALSVLMSVLLDEWISTLSPKWVDAAVEVGAYLYSQKGHEISISSDTSSTTDSIVQFLARSGSMLTRSTRPKNGTSEWNVELSILKMLIDMSDPNHTFDGLKQVEEAKGAMLWTIPTDQGESSEELRQRKSNEVKGPRERSANESDALVDGNRVRKSDDEKGYDILSPTRNLNDGSVGSDHSVFSDEIVPEPDLDELSRKHAELSSLHSSVAGEKVPLAFYRSASDSENGDEHGAEMILNPKAISPRIIRSIYSDDEESSSSSSVPTNETTYFDILQGLSLPPLSTTTIFKDFSFTRRDRIKRDTLFGLFDKLAIFDNTEAVQDLSQYERNVQEIKRILGHSETICQEMTGQLDGSRLLSGDIRLVHVKVGVARQAKKLATLAGQVLAVKHHEAALQHEERRRKKMLQVYTHELKSPIETRRLLLRLSDLENRVLIAQIEMQNLSLGVYTAIREMNDIFGCDDTFEVFQPFEAVSEESEASDGSVASVKSHQDPPTIEKDVSSELPVYLDAPTDEFPQASGSQSDCDGCRGDIPLKTSLLHKRITPDSSREGSSRTQDLIETLRYPVQPRLDTDITEHEDASGSSGADSMVVRTPGNVRHRDRLQAKTVHGFSRDGTSYSAVENVMLHATNGVVEFRVVAEDESVDDQRDADSSTRGFSRGSRPVIPTMGSFQQPPSDEEEERRETRLPGLAVGPTDLNRPRTSPLPITSFNIDHIPRNKAADRPPSRISFPVVHEDDHDLDSTWDSVTIRKISRLEI